MEIEIVEAETGAAGLGRHGAIGDGASVVRTARGIGHPGRDGDEFGDEDLCRGCRDGRTGQRAVRPERKGDGGAKITSPSPPPPARRGREEAPVTEEPREPGEEPADERPLPKMPSPRATRPTSIARRRTRGRRRPQHERPERRGRRRRAAAVTVIGFGDERTAGEEGSAEDEGVDSRS